MAQTDQVLKVDVAGRVWTPRARREEVLDEFERSGMAAAKNRVPDWNGTKTTVNMAEKR